MSSKVNSTQSDGAVGDPQILLALVLVRGAGGAVVVGGEVVGGEVDASVDVAGAMVVAGRVVVPAARGWDSPHAVAKAMTALAATTAVTVLWRLRDVKSVNAKKDNVHLPLWFWPLWLSRRTIFAVEAELQRFGANVRAARVARGWTQEELAHRTGLASVQVSRIERGKREVRLSTLLRLVRALDVPAMSLLEGLV